MPDFTSTGFSELDNMLGGLPKPSCVSICGEESPLTYPFIFNLVRNFLGIGLKGLYVCLNRGAEEMKLQMKRFGINAEIYEKKQLAFLDLFSESQKALLGSDSIEDLTFNPNKIFDVISNKFSDKIRDGFLVIDSVDTLTLNIDEEKAYGLIRALKMLTNALNLVTIGINRPSTLKPEVFNVLRSNADAWVTVEDDILRIEKVLGSRIDRIEFKITIDADGNLNLKSFGTISSRDIRTKVLEIFSEANQVSVRPILTHGITEVTSSSPEIFSVLEELEKAGILRSEPYCSSVQCPNCNSPTLHFYLKCPYCESTLLEKGQALEHTKCGHVDFQKNFEADGELKCPKCGKQLRALGVDYRKVSSIYQCSNGHVSTEIMLMFRCPKCNSTFNLEGAHLSFQRKYRITDFGKIELERIKKNLNRASG